ncbi:MAG: hypothetical protein ACUVWO_07645 [Thermodesulfobacteriota bacterium]
MRFEKEDDRQERCSILGEIIIGGKVISMSCGGSEVHLSLKYWEDNKSESPSPDRCQRFVNLRGIHQKTQENMNKAVVDWSGKVEQ